MTGVQTCALPILRIVRLWKWFIGCTLLLIWFSVFFGFALMDHYQDSFIYLGGMHGYNVSRWLVSQVGVPGVWMILLITAVCFFIYISARTIIWLRKLFALSFLKRQKKEEEKETAEEGTQEFTTSQPQEVEFNLKRTYKQTPPPAPVMDIQAEEPKEESPVNTPEPDDELPSADEAEGVTMVFEPTVSDVVPPAAQDELPGEDEPGFQVETATSEEEYQGPEQEPYNPMKDLENYRFPTIDLSFATTADAFNQFLDQSGVNQRIYELLDKTDIDDVTQLAKAGAQIRQWIIDTPFQPELENAIREAYAQLSADDENASFAVRSSATAEDMPDASFAGQQETFLNVQGFDAVLVAVKHVFASLFNDRAISYRVHQGYDHRGVALSAGVQRMVRSDLASSGVMFSIDTESGFDQVVFITSAWGLGEMVVQGAVNPDEFYVHKPTLAANRPAIVRRTMGSKKIRMVYAPTQEHGKQVKIEDVPQEQRDIFSLTNEEVQELAKQAVQIEKHYGRPMDIEWAKDGHTGKLFIVQARPETVRSRGQVMERYTLHSQGKIIAEGRAIGHRIGAGPVKVIHDISEMNRIEPGDVLVTDMTDPDWEPIMKKASAIVTNRGGRTCHAAIIARELGIPLLTIDELDHVDLAIDGVDEIDPQFNAIKGGGGALYREKVVASMAKEVIWIMDESKLVDKIGAFHLPVEIAQYGSKQAMERMAAYGWNPVLRVRDGKTFVTDNGNFIADLHLGAGFDIQDVYSKLTGMLGVLEHGLFLNMCKRMIVGHSNGEVQVIENPSK